MSKPDLAAALSMCRTLAADAATEIQSHACDGPAHGIRAGCSVCAALLALDNLDKLATAALAAEGKV